MMMKTDHSVIAKDFVKNLPLTGNWHIYWRCCCPDIVTDYNHRQYALFINNMSGIIFGFGKDGSRVRLSDDDVAPFIDDAAILKRARLRQGWTGEELAEKVGCGPQTIRDWECGRRSPVLPYARKLTELLGIFIGRAK